MRTELVQYRHHHRMTVSETGIVWGPTGSRLTVYHMPSIEKDVVSVNTASGVSLIFTIEDLIKAAFEQEILHRVKVDRCLYIERVPKAQYRMGVKPRLLTRAEKEEGCIPTETRKVRAMGHKTADALSIVTPVPIGAKKKEAKKIGRDIVRSRLQFIPISFSVSAFFSFSPLLQRLSQHLMLSGTHAAQSWTFHP